MLRVKGAMLFELSGKDEAICYAQLKDYFEQMYFANQFYVPGFNILACLQLKSRFEGALFLYSSAKYIL